MTALMDQLESHREVGGAIVGVAVGTVTANDDPQGLGRVKLNFPWREASFTTDWVRCVAPMAGAGRGAYFIPEVGDEVLVAFEREDIRKPYVLGALWSDTDKPPDANDSKKNDHRVIKSRKGHMLQFDDSAAKGVITVQLSDGKKVEIDDDGIRITDTTNSIKIDTKSGAISIEATASLSLKAPQITIEASGTLELKGGGSLSASAGVVRIN
ncbi:phage baseplate assembly protein V [Sphingomonas bacterium]|uniref:phage baseplate assembly protein V n=1 Tax=Sphingomonas bacterium TaxID=1895847 RepID=UPI0026201728|nr:phage baseplate assembly protein V [Sphingomonas bacterium]MDB5678528.1 phage tail protein [Sphingomonas bacterium]